MAVKRHMTTVVLALAFLLGGTGQFMTASAQPGAKGRPTIDGAQCGVKEFFTSHEHQYVALFKNGHHVNLPQHVGILPDCIYWLHTHDPTYPGGVNILHNELPNHRSFNLGSFLDIWKYWGTHMRRDTSFLAAMQHAKTLHVFYNGKPWTRSYRSIPLRRHGVIYIEIGNPVVKPKPHNFSDLKGFESSH